MVRCSCRASRSGRTSAGSTTGAGDQGDHGSSDYESARDDDSHDHMASARARIGRLRNFQRYRRSSRQRFPNSSRDRQWYRRLLYLRDWLSDSVGDVFGHPMAVARTLLESGFHVSGRVLVNRLGRPVIGRNPGVHSIVRGALSWGPSARTSVNRFDRADRYLRLGSRSGKSKAFHQYWERERPHADPRPGFYERARLDHPVELHSDDEVARPEQQQYHDEFGVVNPNSANPDYGVGADRRMHGYKSDDSDHSEL